MRISGATGSNGPLVNGVYRPVGEAYNGKKLFQKEGDNDMWLRYALQFDNWTVSTTEHKDANDGIGWCHSTVKSLAHPTEAKAWKVWDGITNSAKKWEDQPVTASFEVAPPPLTS